MRWALGGRLLTVWVFAACFFADPVRSAGEVDPDFPEMSQRLVRGQVLRADFRQERTLRALNRPLISHGKLIFAAEDGVLWHLVEPFVVFVLMRPGEVIEWSEEGVRRRTETASDPVFGTLTDVVLSTLSGDSQKLRQHFDLSSAPSESGWRLSLRPRSAALAAAVSGIEVSGQQFVERVRVIGAKGDMTTIQFSGFSLGASGLNEIEKDYFGQ